MGLFSRTKTDPAAIAQAVAAELAKQMSTVGARTREIDPNTSMRSMVAPVAPNPLPRDASYATLPFNPGSPLIPSPIDPPEDGGERAAPRRYQYPVGWNLQTGDQRLVPWSTLRQLADPVLGCNLVRRCIEIRKAEIIGLDWDVTIKASVVKQVAQDDSITQAEAGRRTRDRFGGDIARIKAFFENPDARNQMTWSDWVMSVLEDHFVYDAVALYPRRNLRGDTVAFENIDGSTIKPLLDTRGFVPMPPHPAYQQILQGFPRGEWMAYDPSVVAGEFQAGTQGRDVLVYRVRNKRTYSPFGLSPVEQSIDDADMFMKRREWLRSEYTDGGMPRSYGLTEEPFDPQQLRQIQAYFDNMLQGQTRNRSRMTLLPQGIKPEQALEHDERYKPEYDEFLIKQIGSKFGVAPTQLGVIPRTGLAGRGQQEGEQKQAETMSQHPTEEWLIDLLNDLAVQFLDMPAELTFTLNETAGGADAYLDAQTAALQLSSGLETLNGARAEIGQPPYDFPEADMPFMQTQNGPVFFPGSSLVVDGGEAPPADAEPQPTPADEPQGRDVEAEAKKFVTFAQSNKRKKWRDFEFHHVHPDTAKALNDAGRAGNTALVKALAATAGKAHPRVGPGRHADLVLTAHYAPLIAAAKRKAWRGLRQAAQQAVDSNKSPADDVARALAILNGNVTVDPTELIGLLRELYGDGYVAGAHEALEALSHSATVSGALGDLVAGIDWSNWEPGWGDAANAVADAGLAQMLSDAGLTIAGIDDTDLGRMAAALAEGIAAGDSVDTLTQSLLDVLDDPDRAEMIASTETNRAMSTATLNTYLANGVAEKMWLVADPCPICADNEGAGAIPVDDSFPSGDDAPPAHPYCFPGWVEVNTSRVEGSASRWYDGDLVEITTRAGHFLSVTPNHPVLTPKGFIPAGSLHEGGDVVSSLRPEWVTALVDPHHHHRPALIEDVAVTLHGASSVTTVTMPSTTEDFHGDGEGSEVCVIRTDRLLGHRVHATIVEPEGHKFLGGRGVEPASFTRGGSSALLIERRDPASHGSVGSHDAGSALSGSSTALLQLVGLGDGPHADPALNEGVRKSLSTDPERLGELVDRLAGLVSADPIVSIRRRPFSGQVFNLQTSTGWYIANNILVHNCRCAIAPVDPLTGDQGDEE